MEHRRNRPLAHVAPALLVAVALALACAIGLQARDAAFAEDGASESAASPSAPSAGTAADVPSGSASGGAPGEGSTDPDSPVPGTVLASNPFDDATMLNEPDGTYTVEVELEGGSGKAHVASPAELEVLDRRAAVRLAWSSPYYDYMIVGGAKYLPVNESGDSEFVVPVLAFDKPFPVIGDTTAMSEAHEVDYTLTVVGGTVRPIDEDCIEDPAQPGQDATTASAAPVPWPWIVFIVCTVLAVGCIVATVILLRTYRRSR